MLAILCPLSLFLFGGLGLTIHPLYQNSLLPEENKNETLLKRSAPQCPRVHEATRSSYDELVRSGQNPRKNEIRIDDFLRLAGLQPGQKVLDLGSGVGYTATEMKKRVGNQGKVIGIDFSTLSIAKAKQYAQDQGQDVEFHLGDINRIGVLLQRLRTTYDVIICQNSFEYIDYPERSLTSWGNFLRPGGRIVFNVTPVQAETVIRPVRKAIKELGIRVLEVDNSENFESEANLSALIQRAGFQGSIHRSRVYTSQPFSRKFSQAFALGELRGSAYGCFWTPELERKTIEIFNYEFNRHKTAQDVVTISVWYYDAVAIKPEKDLK